MVKQWFLTVLKKKVVLHSLAWLFFASIFLLGLSPVETFPISLILILVIFLPVVPAVYLHFYLFEMFFRNKRYFPYLVSMVPVFFLYGQLIDYMLGIHLFPDDLNPYVAGELTLGGFILVATGIRYFFIGINAKNKLIEIEAKQGKAEFDSLRQQVNPHFLFNSLNNIYGLLNEDVDRAGDSLLKLSSLLRYLIYVSQKTRVSLEDEINFIDDYIGMERLRLGEKCKLNFDKNGDFSNRSLSPLLLIPFVENAFKHGSFATIDESFIQIEISIQNDRLHFNVKNSVKGSLEKTDNGVGISNVKRRLELLLPEKHRLDITHGDGIFNVNLEMKL